MTADGHGHTREALNLVGVVGQQRIHQLAGVARARPRLPALELRKLGRGRRAQHVDERVQRRAGHAAQPRLRVKPQLQGVVLRLSAHVVQPILPHTQRKLRVAEREQAAAKASPRTPSGRGWRGRHCHESGNVTCVTAIVVLRIAASAGQAIGDAQRVVDSTVVVRQVVQRASGSAALSATNSLASAALSGRRRTGKKGGGCCRTCFV